MRGSPIDAAGGDAAEGCFALTIGLLVAVGILAVGRLFFGA